MALKIGEADPKLAKLFARTGGKATVPVPDEVTAACRTSFTSGDPFAVTGSLSEVAETVRAARRWAHHNGRSVTVRYPDPNGAKTKAVVLVISKTTRPRKPKPTVVEAPNGDGTSTVVEDQAAAASV